MVYITLNKEIEVGKMSEMYLVISKLPHGYDSQF